MILGTEERERFDRHFKLPGVGEAGQKRLRESRILVIGAGGLGSPVILYLAAAGVGELVVLDDDVVSLGNLQRQVLHATPDLGRPKVDSAADRVRALHPGTRFEGHRVRFGPDNAARWLVGVDVVVNCADNFSTRYAAGDAAVRAGVPMIHGAVHRFQGEVAVFAPEGPCYRCLHPVPPEQGTIASCDEAGVLGVLPGVIGCLQAAEAVKSVVGIGVRLDGRVVHVDLLAGRTREMRLGIDPRCPFHGHGRIAIEAERPVSCAPNEGNPMIELTPVELKAKLDRGDAFTLVDVREPYELEIARIPAAVNIPLGTLPQALGQLDPDAEIVLLCRSGKRSADALEFLKMKGFENLVNVKGGILAWSDTVDPSVTKY